MKIIGVNSRVLEGGIKWRYFKELISKEGDEMTCI